jgi:EAL domain-containing protein (putative c-di-GMP-specific phosphodiesterase class I)
VHRTFVAELGRHPDEPALATAILQLAHHLGMQTVAEGVEDAVQVEALLALGCRFAQGFHFSRPLTAEEFLVLLAERAGARAAKPAEGLPAKHA